MEESSFERRLCRTLVVDLLREMEAELLSVKAVRFLCDYPWKRGKRLRPITFLLSHHCVQLEARHEIHADGRESRLAASIELLHEASLVHDDIVDRSIVRRGSPTMHVVNGDGLALLIGDYMVFRGLKMILDVAERREDILLAKELTETGLAISQGEADQLDRYLNRRAGEGRMSMDDYLDLIAKKTAAFFAGCAEAGAALAGADTSIRLVFREFGLAMGTAFQMVDDLMDVLGDPDVARKTLQNNVSEGTVTLPMIHAWELHPDEPALKRMAACEEVPTNEQERLQELFSSPEVVARSRASIHDHVTRASAKLDEMPANIYRAGLADLLEYVEHCPWGGLADPPPLPSARGARGKDDDEREGRREAKDKAQRKGKKVQRKKR